MIGITSNNLMDLPMEKRFELFRAHGFEAVMIWLGGRDGDDTPEERAKYAVRQGLYIENFHLTADNLNEIWLDDPTGDETIDEMKSEIAVASEYGVKTAVLHLTHGAVVPDISAKGLSRFENLLKFAEEAKVRLAVENVMTGEHPRYVLDNFDSPYLGLCYDSGHDNLWRVADWLSLYSNRLFAMHLHDNFAVKDSHLIPGDGNINWETLLPRLKNSSYKGAIALETKDAADIYRDADKNDYLDKVFLAGRRIAARLPENP